MYYIKENTAYTPNQTSKRSTNTMFWLNEINMNDCLAAGVANFRPTIKWSRTMLQS